MTRAGEEFHVVVPRLEAGADYAFVTEDDRQYPDPVSRCQPHGVHGASRVVDPNAFLWSDKAWTGVSLRDCVIYELHTGTFTTEGTFEAIIPRLSYLRELGITAIELMPIAEFPGSRNWGYDGVCPYAPHSRYGGPAGLKKLVDACHSQGLGVILDVVYNHLGPEGNYLGVFAPYFTETYRTPWGAALNFDGQYSSGVRRYFIDNALYWVTEYHIDGLRLDAVHGIFDFGACHILQELTEAVHHEGALLGRTISVIAESDLNDVRIVKSLSSGGYGLDAQWLDEFHHSLRSVLIQSGTGYLADFGTMADLNKAVTEGFVHDGNCSKHRRKRHGSSSRDLPGRQFVVFIQNHDQVANASLGDRLATLLTLDQQKLAAILTLCSPYVPLLFMGQEYGETSPFYYFTSFDDPSLADAVREGRRNEFAAFAENHDFADPQDPTTFNKSKLDWSRLTQTPHSGVLRLYQDLIALRKRWTCLGNCRKDLTRTTFSEQSKWMVMERVDSSPPRALLVCNFGNSHQIIPVVGGETEWRLEIWTAAGIYGGTQDQQGPPELLGLESSEIMIDTGQAALYISCSGQAGTAPCH
jgi:maltooligosyltrehalose trehalohydrolase